jgi:pilus assembly protein CpaB
MSLQRILSITLAIAVAGGTALGVRSWSNAQRQPVAAAEPVVVVKHAPAAQILVAARDLPAGTILRPGDYHWQAWPENGLADTYVVKKEGAEADAEAEKTFTAAVVRRGIALGEPITSGRVVRQGEQGFLAAILTPGMRAVSVPVNATSGVAGLLFPGDRVDIILTHEIGRRGANGEGRRRASETVLNNVRLLAVDQQTNDQTNQPAVAKNATLEVTPEQAEAITMLVDMGRLSLSLRSLGMNGGDGAGEAPRRPAGGPSYTLDSQVSALLEPVRPRSKGTAVVVVKPKRRVAVVRGAESEALVFTDDGTPVPPVRTAKTESGE